MLESPKYNNPIAIESNKPNQEKVKTQESELNLDQKAKTIAYKIFKIYDNINKIIRNEQINNSVVFDKKLLTDFTNRLSANKQELTPITLSNLSRMPSSEYRIFSDLMFKITDSSKKGGDNMKTKELAKSFKMLIKNLNLSELKSDYQGLSEESEQELNFKVYSLLQQTSNLEFELFSRIVTSKLKEKSVGTFEKRNESEVNHTEIKEEPTMVENNEVHESKALKLMYEQQYFELNNQSDQASSEKIKLFKTIKKLRGERAMFESIANFLSEDEYLVENKNWIDDEYNNKVRITKPNLVTRNFTKNLFNDVQIKFYTHPKINEIAGKEVERLVIGFKDENKFEEVFGHYSKGEVGGFAIDKGMGDSTFKVSVTRSTDNKRSDATDLHEMLHAVDPHIHKRKGTNRVLTEVLAYCGMYDTIQRDNFEHLLVHGYETKFGMKDVPQEFEIIVKELLDHAEYLEKKYGHIDMLRIVAMSKTIEKFLEKQ
jgi:hypothetical protein